MTTQKTVTAEDVERWAKTIQRVMDNPKFENDLARLRDTAAQVPALQARVAELTRERDDWGAAGDFDALSKLVADPDVSTIIRAHTEGGARFEFDSSELVAVLRERDALRAQVERLTHERDCARLALLEVVAPESKRPAALSTPSAEAKTTDRVEDPDWHRASVPRLPK